MIGTVKLCGRYYLVGSVLRFLYFYHHEGFIFLLNEDDTSVLPVNSYPIWRIARDC